MPEALWVGGSTSTIDLDDPPHLGPRDNGHSKHLGGAPLWELRADGHAPHLDDSPLWEPRPRANGNANDLGGATLREPRVPPQGFRVMDVDHVTCLDGVALWELRTDEPAAGLASHLESVRLPTPDEVEAPTSTASSGLWLASVGRLAARTYLGARHAAGDPRLTGVLRAAPSVASFIARSRARSAGAALDDTVVPVRATPGLALQAYLDEVLVAVLRHPELLPKESDCASAAADIGRLRDLFAREGWLDQPAAYHRDPPPPHDLEAWSEHRAGLGFEHIAFSSGWEPSPLEPGWARWMGHEANQTVHASVSRVPGRHHRSWLVCAHGLGMGNNPAMDLRAFRASQLARRGINVVVPVLPLHGPRASGRSRGEDLMTIDMVDSMHGVAQAAWDLRRIIRWLREEQGAEQVGVIGYSLGGLVASIVASLEDDLACVIAGIPVVDLPHLVRRHSPPGIARLADTSGVLGPSADEVHRVVSPLAMDCKVPFERRFIFAGLADRMSTFGHARRLWLHWDRPAFETYAGGHVGFFWSPAVKRFVDEALRRSYTNAAAA
jgi:dienelactone hydrolase